MKKLFCLFYLLPFFGISQIQHLDSIQSKTIGVAWSGTNRVAWLQEKKVDGNAFYYLIYEDFFNAFHHASKVIKFTGGQQVLDDLYRSLLDAMAKSNGGKTFIKLGDQFLSIQVKTDLLGRYIDIDTDGGEFQLDERRIRKLFGK
jgi:hypothetical protein